MAVLVGTFIPGSESWEAARTNGVGGSEVAPILGLSPFESRFSLWHRKAGTIGPAEESPEMEWGTRLEAAVAAKFLDEHPEFDGSLHPGATWCHEDRPWQIASPDRLLCDAMSSRTKTAPGELRALLEVKTARESWEWGEPGTDQIPIHYRCQVLWYLDTFGLDTAYVAVLISGSDYREYVVRYEAAEAAELRAAAELFLDELKRGRLPDIDQHSATYQAIRELHPDIDPLDVELDEDTALRFVVARARLSESEEIAQLAKNRVADLMGNARRATWDGHVIATRQAKGDGRPYVVAGRKLPSVELPTRKDAA
jgi:putative phage-type endonuclease